jgi:hypothetical protein
MGEGVVGGPAGSTGPTAGAPSSPPQMVAATASASANNEAIEKLEVILGHPFLRAPGDVFLSEMMGMAHWLLNQVRDVLHRERGTSMMSGGASCYGFSC